MSRGGSGGWRLLVVAVVLIALGVSTRGRLVAQTPPPTTPPAAAQPEPSSPPAATPEPTATPALTPSPSPRPVLVDNGVELLGVFASDIDDFVTAGDEFQIVAAVRVPGVQSVTMRLSGAPFLRASSTFDLVPGDNWLQIPNFRVDNESEPVIREELIRKVGGTIAVRDGALVAAFDFTDPSGAARTATFQPAVYEFLEPTKLLLIHYPNLSRVTGMPPGSESAHTFYLRGDLDFHHPEDYYVRKLAFEAGRRGGGFPDDPETVADNIFHFINGLLGDADPGDFNNDYNIARLIEEGRIRRGQLNGGYICIAQIYFYTALSRTLGLPTRELNLAIARPDWLGNDGVWRVKWWQESAAHVWYNGEWHLYDTWLGFKGAGGYFQANLAFQMWAAFDRRAVEFTTVRGERTGLRGHDFNAWPGDPPQWEFVVEAVKPGYRVLGMPDETGAVITRRTDGWSDYLAPDAAWAPRGPAIEAAQPPAMGIATLPETRP